MKEDYITFDFANGKIEVRNSGEQGTIEMPDLADKRTAIYACRGGIGTDRRRGASV